jgi:hypothetical protein
MERVRIYLSSKLLNPPYSFQTNINRQNDILISQVNTYSVLAVT